MINSQMVNRQLVALIILVAKFGVECKGEITVKAFTEREAFGAEVSFRKRNYAYFLTDISKLKSHYVCLEKNQGMRIQFDTDEGKGKIVKLNTATDSGEFEFHEDRATLDWDREDKSCFTYGTWEPNTLRAIQFYLHFQTKVSSIKHNEVLYLETRFEKDHLRSDLLIDKQTSLDVIQRNELNEQEKKNGLERNRIEKILRGYKYSYQQNRPDVIKGILEQAILNQAKVEKGIVRNVIVRQAMTNLVKLQQAIVKKKEKENAKKEEIRLEKERLENIIQKQIELEEDIVERNNLKQDIRNLNKMEKDKVEQALIDLTILDRGKLENAKLEEFKLEQIILSLSTMEKSKMDLATKQSLAKVKYVIAEQALKDQKERQSEIMKRFVVERMKPRQGELDKMKPRQAELDEGKVIKDLFENGQLKREILEKAKLEQIKPRQLKLKNSILEKAKLEEAKLEQAITEQNEREHFLLKKVILEELKQRQAKLEEVKQEQLRLERDELEEAVLEEAVLKQALENLDNLEQTIKDMEKLKEAEEKIRNINFSQTLSNDKKKTCVGSLERGIPPGQWSQYNLYGRVLEEKGTGDFYIAVLTQEIQVEDAKNAVKAFAESGTTSVIRTAFAKVECSEGRTITLAPPDVKESQNLPSDLKILV